MEAAAAQYKGSPPFCEPIDYEVLWGDDVFICRGLMQQLGFDPAAILEELTSLPQHSWMPSSSARMSRASSLATIRSSTSGT